MLLTPNVLVQVTLTWEQIGSVTLDQTGRPLFPKAPSTPGVYRFSLSVDDRLEVYIGETDELARRFQHYRTPGPSQRTNIRINQRIVEVMAAGGAIEVAIAVRGVKVSVQENVRVADLALKQERVLVEHAALLAETASGVSILNA